MLWSVSEGRIALLFVLACMPALVERIDVRVRGRRAVATDGGGSRSASR